jgi:hypothetical protein
MKEWLIPALRWIISGAVGMLAGWLMSEFGVEITQENRAFLESTFTTLGLALVGAITALFSKWLKPRFMRKTHP